MDKIKIIREWLFWIVYPSLSKYPDGDINDSNLTDEDIQQLIKELNEE